MSRRGWIGVDLNGTLARYVDGQPHEHIGEPVPKMLARVRAWLEQDITVKVVTVRASDPGAVLRIRQWLDRHGLQRVDITDRKAPDCWEMWDDRCVQVIPNTGEPVSPGSSRVPDPVASVRTTTQSPSSTTDAQPAPRAIPTTWSMG